MFILPNHCIYSDFKLHVKYIIGICFDLCKSNVTSTFCFPLQGLQWDNSKGNIEKSAKSKNEKHSIAIKVDNDQSAWNGFPIDPNRCWEWWKRGLIAIRCYYGNLV